MRRIVFLIASCLGILTGSVAYSQAPSNAVEYLDYLGSRDKILAEKYLTYMGEVAHGHRARKIEKKRQDLLQEIKKNVGEATKLKPFNGDATLRDTYKTYWDLLYKVFNEDYHKIVDMEEIAEQSYDGMEAYLTAQQEAGKVLDAAQDKVHPVYEKFAADNNIRLITNDKDKMGSNLK